MGNVQTGNGEWVKRPWGVNSIHYPPYLEILYATFKLNRAETVDTTSSSVKPTHVKIHLSVTPTIEDLSVAPTIEGPFLCPQDNLLSYFPAGPWPPVSG